MLNPNMKLTLWPLLKKSKTFCGRVQVDTTFPEVVYVDLHRPEVHLRCAAHAHPLTLAHTPTKNWWKNRMATWEFQSSKVNKIVGQRDEKQLGEFRYRRLGTCWSHSKGHRGKNNKTKQKQQQQITQNIRETGRSGLALSSKLLKASY